MRKLFLDIETTPNVVYAWSLFEVRVGLSQVIEPTRMMCVAYAFDDEPMQFAAEWQRGGAGRMVNKIYDAVDETDAVVHYAGKSFDEKHLNREFLQLGLTPPSPYETIDIHRVIKQRFKFASSKLEQVARELEVREGKLKTDFGLWRGVMEGDKQARETMRQYNMEDVELLRTLYPDLQPWIKRHPNVALYNDDELEPACTRCASPRVFKNGYKLTSAGKFQRYQCRDCGGYMRGSKRLRTTPLREA